MEKEALRNDTKTIAALFVALMLGIGLHELFSLFPSIITEFISPVNESIWEHVKIVFFPLLLVELAFFPRSHRPAGLFSILLVSGGMLCAGWLYHVCFNGMALWVDLTIYGVCITLYFILSDALPIPKGWMSLLRGLIILFIGIIFAFTITPPHGTLFHDARLADAWVLLTC